MRWGEGAFQGAFHARLLCQAAEFSRHVKICFVRPPDFVRVVKEQIIFVYKLEFKNIAALKVFCFSAGSL